MSCENSWSVRFQDVDGETIFEVVPVTMNLNLNRNKYDFARATFSREAGSMMEPHVVEGGLLNRLLPIDICYDGNPIKRLLFRPDWVDFANNRTHIQFHDVHKALKEARVDIKQQNAELKEIYKKVVNSVPNNIIPEISDENFIVDDTTIKNVYADPSTNLPAPDEEVINEDQTKLAVESNYAIDFDNITAEKAIEKLNRLFYTRSWSNRDGELMVGLPENNQQVHIAADRDERVWRYENPSISHGREPIQEVLIKGPWLDKHGSGGFSDAIAEVDSYFDSSNEQGAADYLAYGIAKRTDIEGGLRVTAEAPDATRGSLGVLAESALKEKMKEQKSGQVKIDPNLSGTNKSHPVDATPGDILHMVPSDEYFENPTRDSGIIGDKPEDRDGTCGSFVYNEQYLITSVQHDLTKSGNWKTTTEVGVFPDVPIESSIAFFDPTSDDWVSDSPIAEDAELKGGWYTLKEDGYRGST